VRRGQRLPQQAVRVGKFEQSLEAMNQELGQKVTESLVVYHERFVEPRLKALETPWWKRWWIKIRGVR